MTDTQSAAQTEVRFVDYLDIIPDNDNVRQTLTDIDQLADSIWAAGLLEPPIVCPNGEGKLHLTAGYRRHAALGKLIKQGRWVGQIPVIVRTDEDRESRLVAMIVENLQRVDVNAVDEALGIQRLIVEHSFTIEDVALNLGISEAVIKTRLALCQLTDLALACVREGKMSVEAGVALSKAPVKVQDKVAKGGTYDMNVSRVKTIIATAASTDFKHQVQAVLKQHDVKIDKEGYNVPKGHVRGKAALVVTPSTINKIGEWLVTEGVIGTSLVRLQSHYQEAKCTLDHYPKLNEAEVEKQQAAVEKQIEERRQQEVATLQEAVTAKDPAVWAWYTECLAIAQQIEAQEGLVDSLRNRHRGDFVRKLSTADVAAAALRKVAVASAYDISQYFGGYNRDYYAPFRTYVCAIFGIEENKLPFDPSHTDEIKLWILADKKRTVAAAALELMPFRGNTTPVLEEQFNEVLATAGEEEGVVVLTYPPAPDSFNAMLVAAQGETFEEGCEGDVDWGSIEQAVEMWVEGEFDAHDK